MATTATDVADAVYDWLVTQSWSQAITWTRGYSPVADQVGLSGTRGYVVVEATSMTALTRGSARSIDVDVVILLVTPIASLADNGSLTTMDTLSELCEEVRNALVVERAFGGARIRNVETELFDRDRLDFFNIVSSTIRIAMNYTE